MTDIIQKIEDHMDKIGEEYDSYGQAVAHERAVDALLPLLKKAIENHAAKQIYLRECKIYGVFPNEKKIADIEKQIADELLKLLGEKHE
jgi:hypothetical protein